MLLYILFYIYFSSSSSRDSETHPTFFLGRSNWMDCGVGKAKKEFRKNGNPSGSQSLRLWYCGWFSQFLMPLAFNKKNHTKCIKDVRNYQPQHLGYHFSHQKKTRPPKGLCDSSFTSPTNGKLKTQRSSSVTGAPATCWAAKRVPSGSAHSLSDPTSLATLGNIFCWGKGKTEKMQDFWIHSNFLGKHSKNLCVWCLDDWERGCWCAKCPNGMTQKKNPAKSEKIIGQVIYDYCTLCTSTSQPTFHGSPFSTRQDQATGEAVLVQFVESMSCHGGRSGIRKILCYEAWQVSDFCLNLCNIS